MLDVLIVGAGPAGAVAGSCWRAPARACASSIARRSHATSCAATRSIPGTLARLRRLGVGGDVDARGAARRRHDRHRRARRRHRRPLSARAVTAARSCGAISTGCCSQHAIAAGCEFEPGVAVRRATVDDRDGTARVTGVVGGGRRPRATSLPSPRARHDRRGRPPLDDRVRPRPRAASRASAPLGDRRATSRTSRRRRPAVATDPCDVSARCTSAADCYIGVAPVPGGLTNVCLVQPSGAGDADLRDPAALLTRELAARSAAARPRSRARGSSAPPGRPRSARRRRRPRTPIDGLLLAGDAAGFIDPMTGDGLRFAVRGGELAAAAALRRARARMDRRPRAAGRRAAPARSRRSGASIARCARWSSSPRAVDAAAVGARLAPAVLRAVIARAGDCDLRRDR